MALQKAVIAPDLEGIRGIIKNGETGLLYNCNDPSDFMDKLIMLIKNKAQRTKL